MNNQSLKKQLHEYIELIKDQSQLEILYETAEGYATDQKSDIRDFLSEKQLIRLEESIKQADNGKLIPHEEVLKISKKWLTK